MTSNTDRPSVVLVGLGNIGFRHLQGLARIAHRVNVTAIDPAASARDRASAEWQGTVGDHLDVADGLDALPDRSHVVIVATSASGRLELLRQVLARTTPQHIVLEKVVFQQLSDFDAAAAAAQDADAQIIVNCPRRMWPLYQALKSLGIGGSPDLELTVRWRDLGLACNSVHLIDALQFLAASSDVQLEAAGLGDVYPAKRDGYLEVYGTLSIMAPGGKRLRIDVLNDGPATMEASLVANGKRYVLSESAGRLLDANGAPLCDVGRPPFQSELTGALVAAILDGQTPPLASLAESRVAHTVLFAALEPHFCNRGIDVSAGLPIS